VRNHEKVLSKAPMPAIQPLGNIMKNESSDTGVKAKWSSRAGTVIIVSGAIATLLLYAAYGKDVSPVHVFMFAILAGVYVYGISRQSLRDQDDG
jgi:hypothetical protein